MSRVISGLIIALPYIQQILRGEKTWEIRGKRTDKRERIALIQKKEKKILGTCEIVDVIGPLTLRDLRENLNLHRDKIEELPYKTTYAWVIDNVVKFTSPIPFKNPSGAVIWVKLPDEIAQEIENYQGSIYQSPNDNIKMLFMESLAQDFRDIGHHIVIKKLENTTEFSIVPRVFNQQNVASIYKSVRDRNLIEDKDFILRAEQRIIEQFVDGKDINIHNIQPEIRICTNKRQREIFKYCRYLQSVPTSDGSYQRFQALVYDVGQKKEVLMGVLGYTSTAHSLSARDDFLLWTAIDSKSREKLIRNRGLKRLKQLSVCLALPPYSYLFGAKLMAALALSDPIQEEHQRRYKKSGNPPLLGLVTTVATQTEHCPIFNRIHLNKISDIYTRRNPSNLYLHIGKTSPLTDIILRAETKELAKKLFIYSSPKEKGKKKRVFGIKSGIPHI